MGVLVGVLVGLVLALLVFEVPRQLARRRSSSEIRATQAALHAATVMLPYLRRGLSEESAHRAVEHLLTLTHAAAVALGDRQRVLAFVGAGEDHHHAGDQLLRIQAPAREDHLHVEDQVACDHAGCPLGPAVVAPLLSSGEVVGSVVAIFTRGYELTGDETRTVAEAAKLVSAQLELAVVEEQAQALAQAEMAALRAQIRPHFIYNALAAIASQIHSDPDGARELLTEFAEFIRYAFRRQAPFVSLADEFGYVEKYLRLEQARFGDRLEVIYALAPDTLDARVPVLSLQPLVENAVRHGVEQRGRGRVRIAAERQDGAVSLTVIDDGVGMTAERAEAVLSGSGGGVGLANVQARLLASFGPAYGLTIQSSPEVGTTVTMTLPELTPSEALSA
ncbi:MAG: histidine kinase [Solirubrobacterales bacterium]|nr:histidine kinase [Solirubrobacterales bacterium]